MAGLASAGFVLPAIDLSGVGAAEPAVAPPSLDELYRPAGMLDVALSPNGTQVACLREIREETPNPKAKAKGEKPFLTKRTAMVTLYASADLNAKPSYVRVGDFDVEQVEWANDRRLLIWVQMTQDAEGNRYGLWFDGVFYPIPVRRVISVGVGGDEPVILFGKQGKATKQEFDLGDVVDRLSAEDDYILMKRWDLTTNRYALYKVNVLTGEGTLFELGERATDGWHIQNGVPVLRYDSNLRRTVFSVYGRAPGGREWKLVNRYRRDALKKLPDFDVVGSAAEPGVVLISHRGPGEEFCTIKTFDVRTMKMGGVFRAQATADLTGVIVDEADRLVATTWRGDRLAYAFEDPKLAGHYRGINKFYGDACNVGLYDISLDHTHALFHVSGPRQPGQFVYYNLKTRHLDVLGDQFEHLTADRLARMDTLAVTCRDGAAITAYLSHPLGEAGPRPMVVMPHGGPEMRDYLAYDRWVQALCAQGWLVLQPNFRGSGGYGRSFGDAGRRRWGDRMQEDVEDAVAHIVKAGLADPRRLAIMGASYGGYAAAMGVVREPDLYRCAVAIAGVYDLLQSLDETRDDDGSNSEAYAYWVASMGDPKTQKDKLIADSPRRRATEIKVPVLLLHGTEDEICRPEQAREMAKALKKAGVSYQHVEFKGEGHPNWSDDNEKKMLTQATDFIAKAFAA